MKSEITKSEESSATLTIALDQEGLKKHVAKVYENLRPKVKAAGFRPGKAPDHVIERELGSGTVQSEVLEAAIMASYAEAVQKHELAVVASPEISVTKFVPYTELEYTAKVDVLPPIKLPDYKKIKKKRPEVKVTEADVDQRIEEMRKQVAKPEAVDQAAKSGDTVTLDFDGVKDGQAVAGASAKGHKLELGSKSFIPGFEEEVVGLKAGDIKTFDITFPKDYQEASLAGQRVTFTITVHEVSQTVLPELDDAFATQVGPYKSVAEMREDVKKRLESDKTQEAARQFEEEVLGEIAEKSEIKLPAAMVERQLDAMKDELKQQLGGMGLDIEQYLNLGGKDMSELDKEMRPQAEKRVRTGLVISEIAKLEKIDIDHDDVHKEIDRLKALYPDPQMQAELDSAKVHDEIGSHLLSSRTIAKLVEYVEKK